MTEYILRGDVEYLRQHHQSAVSTKNGLRLSNSPDVKIADNYRVLSDGTVIHAMKRYDREIVTVDGGPPPGEPEEVLEQNVSVPPVMWTIESFYIVFNVVKEQASNPPQYTGEHLAGFHIPPYLDLEFETRIKGTPGYFPIDCVVGSTLHPNRAIEPTIEQAFTREPEPITNYDAFEKTTNHIYKTWHLYGVYDESGCFHAIYGSQMEYYNAQELLINGKEFRRYVAHSQHAAGTNWMADSIVRHVGTTGTPFSKGNYMEFEVGLPYPPNDDRKGDASEGDYTATGRFTGGAYDPETDAFICMHMERTSTQDWDPETTYLTVGVGTSAEIQMVIAQEYEEWYGLFVIPLDCKIYNLAIGQLFLVSYLVEDEFNDYNKTVYYKVFKKDSDGNYKIFEKDLAVGTSNDRHFYHYLTDKDGSEWPVNGTFRVVRDIFGMTEDGEFITHNPADEQEYDADIFDVVQDHGYSPREDK